MDIHVYIAELEKKLVAAKLVAADMKGGTGETPAGRARRRRATRKRKAAGGKKRVHYAALRVVKAKGALTPEQIGKELGLPVEVIKEALKKNTPRLFNAADGKYGPPKKG